MTELDSAEPSASAGPRAAGPSPARRPRPGEIPRPIVVVSLGVFLNRVGGFFAIFLTLVLADRGYDAGQITLGLALVAGAGMAGAGVSGLLADRIGRRRSLLLFTLLTAAFSALLAEFRGYTSTLVLACLLSAAVQAYGPVAQAVVGEAAPAEHRVTMFALYRLALNVGAAVGPLIGGIWAAGHMDTLLLGNAAVSAASCLLLLALPADRGSPRGTPEPTADPTTDRTTGQEAGQATGQATGQEAGQAGRGPLGDPRFVGVCVLLGLISLVYAQQTGPLPLAMKDSGFSTGAFGALLTLNAVVVIACEVPLSVVIQRWPVRVPICLGAVCVFGGYLVNAVGVTWPVLVAGVLLWTAGEMLISPVAAAAATAAAPPGAVARYQSVLGFCQSTGMSLGPAVGVFAYGLGATWPWVLSGLLGLLVTPALFRLLAGRR
ncbi:MFS transporter [Streptomyces sp. NRRL WC-3742]|uniref:MFS transporter n=1 Tax=Streptomyces sp. NRRL WC-3742 TaxID=1463934 RepID=UPI0004CAE4B9|nr:MFS transporter [Streptomyces sp. NRRL WC-3742]